MHKSFPSMRPLVSQATLAAGVMLSLGGEASAQTAAAPADAVALDQLNVEGASGGGGVNVNNQTVGISRLPARVQDIPQTVNVVPQKIIQEQQATTLEQVLRNVPGITISAGEGNGGQNGDQFRIRGIDARGDIYVDGLRDFGAYTRDSFNTESVEVFMGPIGEAFGIGSAGGVINQTSKRAHLGNAYIMQGSGGSGPLWRGTADVNYQINDVTAIRLNAMVHEQSVLNRDNVSSDRKGFAGSLAWGINQPTQVRLDYFYQYTNRIPDYGVPFLSSKAALLYPLTEAPGVNRGTSYVRNRDQDISNVQYGTLHLEHQALSWLSLYNDTRFTAYNRNYASTAPNACTFAIAQCATIFWNGGNPRMTYGAGGGLNYLQDGWGVENISVAKAKFETGPFRHDAIVGLDYYYQKDWRQVGTRTPNVTLAGNQQFLLTPYYFAPDTVISFADGTTRTSTASDIGVIAGDRMWLTDQVSVMGTMRWDTFTNTFTNPAYMNGQEQNQTSSRVSWSASLMYEPTKDATFYGTYAVAFKPPGANVSFSQGATGDNANNNAPLTPEESELVEFGAKSNWFDGRVGVNASIFSITKSNSFFYGEDGSITYGTAESGVGRRVQGFQMNVSGQILDGWDVTLNYAFLAGRITAASNPLYIGNAAYNTPAHNVSLWTSYDVTPYFSRTGLPGGLTVGGGVFYASDYYSDVANTAIVPNFFSLDAFVSYKIDRFTLALNAYNLTDELNYSGNFAAGRVVPSSGRTFLASIGVKF